MLTFAGDVYQGLAAAELFDERDYTEAQKTLRLLSGLYGVLRPLDLMQPYRLEMGTALPTDRGRTLYEFWGTAIAELLAADLAESPGAEAVVNLASQEYAQAVDRSALPGRWVSPRFLDQGADGRYRVLGYFTKRARGELAGWLVRHRVRSVRALRDFDGAGYRFDPGRSTPDEPTFVRGRPSATPAESRAG